MKKITNVLTGILLSSALFTACSKDDGSMAVNPASAPAGAAKAFSPLINFNAGGIQSANLTLTDGSRIVYQTNGPFNLDLGAPAATLKLTPGTYKNLGTRINTSNNPDVMNLWLRADVAMEDGTIQPVEFVMYYPMRLRSTAIDLSVNDETTVMDLLNVQGDLLASDITRDMLSEADRERGVIRISQQMNPHLYDIILDRLRTMIDISYMDSDPDPWKSNDQAIPVSAADVDRAMP